MVTERRREDRRSSIGCSKSCSESASRARWTLVAVLLIFSAGCTSNRFQYANSRPEDVGGFAGSPGYNTPPLQPPVPAYPVGPPPGGFAVPAPQGAIASVPPQAAPQAYGAQPLPPLANADPLPLPLNPNQANTGVLNRRRVTEVPRPGEPGSQLTLEPDGPELVGRVVNSLGQPAPRASIQVLDIARGRRVMAELASGTDGGFRVRNLEYGGQYELQVIAGVGGERLVGSTIAVAPDTAVVIQLQPQDDNSPRAYSPLGNRLSSVAQVSPPADAPRLGIPTANAPVIPAAQAGGAVAVITPPLLGQPVSNAGGEQFQRVNPAMNPSMGSPNLSSPNTTPLPEPGRFPEPPALSREETVPEPLPLPETASRHDMPTSPPTRATRQADGAVAFAGTGLASATAYTTSMAERPLGELPGDLMLFDFFGSWCGPCRRAVPKLNNLHSRYAGQGLRVIGVACEYGDTSEAVATAERTRTELGIQYPLLVSPLEDASEFRDYFHVEKYPTLILIDRQGKVLYQAAGGDDATFAELEQSIRQAVSRLAVN